MTIYCALACDYDSTLAEHGRMPRSVATALHRVKDSGRRLILVTGRMLPDLQSVLPDLGLFDRVVAENGALLYRPQTREELVLGTAPPPEFAEQLAARGAESVSVGRVIVATVKPHEQTVLDCIRELGLELQVVFNREAVMVLPSGINKATGLEVALTELGLSRHNTVGVGDGENDHAFLSRCELAVAVANAVPALRERADHVTIADAGAGVIELTQALVEDDLARISAPVHRADLQLGTRADGSELRVPARGANVLIAGSSGSGKSTLATAFLEQLEEAGYQYCIVDPEGDYELGAAITLGGPKHAPEVEEVIAALEDPNESFAVNLLGLKLEDRPAFFQQFFASIAALRAKTGRPHWLIVDEAHHLLPADSLPAIEALPESLRQMVMVTVHPDRLPTAVLSRVDLLAVIGADAQSSLESFASLTGTPLPRVSGAAHEPLQDPAPGEAIVWQPASGEPPLRIRCAVPSGERRRHLRKYAEGDLGDMSFHFRGPAGKLNLRAQNLAIFLQIADGIDDETWLHHLRRRDYSDWLRRAVKDDELIAEAERIEQEPALPAAESRARLRRVIEQRYTGSA